jgi:hypothetical protein
MKKVATNILMALFVLVLSKCAPSRFVKPLQKNQQAASFSFGGPVIGYAGAAIPIPFTTLAYGRGLSDRLTVFGGLHITSLAFKNAQIDLGGTYGIWQTKKNGLSASLALQTASGIGKPNSFRLWPSADLNYYYHLGSKPSYVYAGLNAWFELANTKAHAQTIERHAIPNLQIGYNLVKTKWQHQFEFKYLGLGIANLPGVVDYKGLGTKGSMGIYYSLIRTF